MHVSVTGKHAFAFVNTDTLGQGAPNQGAIAIFDEQGNFELRREYSTIWGELPRSIHGTSDGGYVVTGSSGYDGGTIHLLKTDSLGNTEWSQTYKDQNPGVSQMGVSVAPTLNGGYVIGTNTSFVSPYLIVTSPTGEIETNLIEGHVFLDNNADCIRDSLEQAYSAINLELTDANSGAVYHTVPNDSGYYQFQLQGGNYTLSTQSNVPYFNWICPPSLISVNTYDTATVDLPLEITNYCPYNTVSVTSPAFPFNTTSQINVLACNNGTLFSANTSVEVELDPALSFVSSIPPPIAQNGQVLTFDLDTLDILECVGIRILAQLDTLTALGATHCVEARIFPDTICGTMPWTGARIQAHATCNNDSVVFSLENQGADMLTGKNYTVYVDDVIFRIAPFQLDSGEVMEIREEALVGATYRIEAEQEPNFPTY
ncbi:MAG: SdrD B-like domain-containing protein, partial [Bacteroidota bacterium]